MYVLLLLTIFILILILILISKLLIICMEVLVGLVSEEIEFFVLASLAMKLCEYTRNTPIRRNPVSKFWKKFFLTVIFWIFEFFENCAILNAFNVSQYAL